MSSYGWYIKKGYDNLIIINLYVIQIWRNSHQWYLIGQTVTKSYQITKYRISNEMSFCVRKDRLIKSGPSFLFSWRKWKTVFLIEIAKVKYPIDQISIEYNYQFDIIVVCVRRYRLMKSISIVFLKGNESSSN